ncbi:MAG: heme exporter protein CcmD [Gammaproteobacteria bacterium]|nr:MAG: heme exporter protein CcmD [Gammaproteobacteria bacterium]
MVKFQFASLADFFAMGGHGAYVWSAYGITAIVLILLVIMPLRRRSKLLAVKSEQYSSGEVR